MLRVINVFGIKYEKFVTKIFSGEFLTSKGLFTINVEFESFSRIKELINRDEMIYGTIGIHPHESSKNVITSKLIIESLNEQLKEYWFL